MQPVIMLVVSGIFMFAVIGGISLMSHYYTLKAAHDTGRTQITAQREFYCVQDRLPPHENKTETVSEMGNHI